MDGWLDETYATGEGFDNWCSTNLPVPNYYTIEYTNPCNIVTCVVSKFTLGNSPENKLIIIDNGPSYCGASIGRFNFVCTSV
jgi:hypothetical protein